MSSRANLLYILSHLFVNVPKSHCIENNKRDIIWHSAHYGQVLAENIYNWTEALAAKSSEKTSRREEKKHSKELKRTEWNPWKYFGMHVLASMCTYFSSFYWHFKVRIVSECFTAVPWSLQLQSVLQLIIKLNMDG